MVNIDLKHRDLQAYEGFDEGLNHIDSYLKNESKDCSKIESLDEIIEYIISGPDASKKMYERWKNG